MAHGRALIIPASDSPSAWAAHRLCARCVSVCPLYIELHKRRHSRPLVGLATRWRQEARRLANLCQVGYTALVVVRLAVTPCRREMHLLSRRRRTGSKTTAADIHEFLDWKHISRGRYVSNNWCEIQSDSFVMPLCKRWWATVPNVVDGRVVGRCALSDSSGVVYFRTSKLAMYAVARYSSSVLGD